MYRLLSLACFAAAVVILAAVGLPERLDYTQLSVVNGQRIAAEIGAFAPPLDLTDMDGQAVKFTPDNHGGTVTVINFWATWCAPCEAEMPALQRLSERYKERGLRVIGVNLGDSIHAVRQWSDRLGLSFTLALDPSGRAAADYRLRGQPTTVIVAADGRIASIIYGPADLAALERFITPLLTEG